MPGWPLGDTYGRMMLGVACNYRPCDTHRDDVGRDMQSLTLSSTHDPMTLGVVCHQRPMAEQTVLQCPAWHAIISLGHHIRWDNVGRNMSSLSFGKTHGKTMSGVACNHIPWTSHTVEKRRVFHAIVVFGLHTRLDDVRHGMPACPLGSKHCQTTSGKAYHHRPWKTYKVRRRRAWHVIIDLGECTRSNDV